MKVKRRWIILMAAMTVIAAAGVFVGEPTFECDWSVISAADVAWLITATIFVLMMTPGLSFFYGGMVGAKNVISTMLQSFIAMGLISVLWVVVGFSLCFGDDVGGVIGNPLTFLMFQNVGADVYTTPAGNVLGGATIPLALFALFQMKFAIITPSLITGSFAERVRFSAYLFFMMFFFFFIYCPLAHMASRRIIPSLGSRRLCWRHCRACIIGYRCSCRSYLFRPSKYRKERTSKHPIRAVGRSITLAGLVRFQCRFFSSR